MVAVVVLLVLASACGSRSSNRDAAVEASYPGSGGTVSSADTGSGGVSTLGAGGTPVSGTGGGTAVGTGGIGAGGVSSAGSGGMGTKSDGALPVADSGTDASAGTDVAITSCEKMAGTCVPTIDGCAICPPGSEPSGWRSECASNAWCCIPASTHASNQCTQNGGLCLSVGTCPDGWSSLRSTCDGSGSGCCRLSAACANALGQLDGGPPDTVVLPPPEPLALACTKAVSCIASKSQGIGECVAKVTEINTLDQSLLTYPMLLNDDQDWLFHIGMAQNVDCVANATSCDAVRACLAPPRDPSICASTSSDFVRGRRCGDATHLLGCSLDTDVRIDCAKLGTSCVESPPTASGDLGIAACALPSPGGPAVPQVTCQDNVARIKMLEAEYTYDCGINATCVAGSFPLSTTMEMCKGKSPGTLTCTSSEVTWRCDGIENLVLSCPDGSQQTTECLRDGKMCMKDSRGGLICMEPCLPYAEQCYSGVITYCAGPQGTAKIDCASLGLGFTSCKWDGTQPETHAWCL